MFPASGAWQPQFMTTGQEELQGSTSKSLTGSRNPYQLTLYSCIVMSRSTPDIPIIVCRPRKGTQQEAEQCRCGVLSTVFHSRCPLLAPTHYIAWPPWLYFLSNFCRSEAAWPYKIFFSHPLQTQPNPQPCFCHFLETQMVAVQISNSIVEVLGKKALGEEGG